jgi:ATP-binding cassette subfamily F protein 1
MFNCLDSDSEDSRDKPKQSSKQPPKQPPKQRIPDSDDEDSDGDIDITALARQIKPSKPQQHKPASKQQPQSKQKDLENEDITKMIQVVDSDDDKPQGQKKKQNKKKKLQKEPEPKKQAKPQNKLFEQSKQSNQPAKKPNKKQLLPPGTLFVEDVEVLLNGKTLINKSKIVINSGIKYFLIGKNGCGKTTLLKMLYDKIKEYDDVLMIDQDIQITSDLTAKDFLLQSNQKLFNAHKRLEYFENLEVDMTDEELEEQQELADLLSASGWNKFVAESQIILDGLGFAENKVVNSLSGGWRMKLALGRGLLNKPNVLLLDESTNHLDIISVIWLTDYLKQYNKTIVMITHDTDVINDLSEYVWFVDNLDDLGNQLYIAKGDYGNVCQMKEQLTKEIADRWDNHQKKVKEMQKKSTPKKEVDEYIASQKVPKPPKPYKVNIQFENPRYTNRQNIIELFDVDFSYGEKPILAKVNFAIDLESRYIIVGRNGAGKTTLFKLCSGLIQPTVGEIRKNDRISVGYYNQQIIESLPLDLTPIECLQSINSELDENKCRAWLGKIGLKKVEASDQCKTKIKDLSGGQKARMAFCVIQMQQPEVLLLDEPTNHLDIESIEALIKGINEFKGAVVVITHDTHLIKSIENYVIYDVVDTKVTKFNGDFEEYTKHVIKQLNLKNALNAQSVVK